MKSNLENNSTNSNHELDQWLESHFEVVTCINDLLTSGNEFLLNMVSEHGRNALYKFSKDVVSKFEEMYSLEDWSGPGGYERWINCITEFTSNMVSK